MSRILLTDDHPMIRTAIVALLRDSGHEVAGVAGSLAEAREQLAASRADILLLDLQLPDGNGLALARELRGTPGAPRIVILTAGIGDALLMEARSLGIAGMVLKSSDPAELMTCLDQVGAGRSWIDPELASRIAELSENFGQTRRPSLAPRERQLIQCVRQGLRNREIAQELGVTEGTVKVYLHGVFEKLGVSSRTELAVRADEFLAESFL